MRDPTIVQCDGCGAHGRRAPGSIAPDFWFYIESDDRTFGKGGVYVVFACSETCRDGMWKRGPARGQIDEDGTRRARTRKAAQVVSTPACSKCGAGGVKLYRARLVDGSGLECEGCRS